MTPLIEFKREVNDNIDSLIDINKSLLERIELLENNQKEHLDKLAEFSFSIEKIRQECRDILCEAINARNK